MLGCRACGAHASEDSSHQIYYESALEAFELLQVCASTLMARS